MDKKRKALRLSAFLSLVLVLSFCFSSCSGVRSGQSASQTISSASAESGVADRYAEIFDSSEDAGKLVARFLKLTSSDPETKSGDSAIVTFPDGQIMLIDAGNPTCGATVVQCLQDMGVEKLDAVVVSHPHIDHVGGMEEVLNAFEVAVIYQSALEYPTETVKNYNKLVDRLQIPVTLLAEGDEFDFGGAHIKIFNPPPKIEYPDGYPENSTQFVNNCSIAMRITYEDSSLLFAGDLYSPGEARIIEAYGEELQSDVIKGNHHGDDTSNTRTFIKTVQPKICVIMHDSLASLDVYKAYRRNDAETYLCYLDGCVKVTADGTKNYQVLTQYDRQSDFLE